MKKKTPSIASGLGKFPAHDGPFKFNVANKRRPRPYPVRLLLADGDSARAASLSPAAAASPSPQADHHLLIPPFFSLHSGSQFHLSSPYSRGEIVSSAEGSRDEASGGDRSVKQDAEVGGGGGGPPLPPQGVQSVRQAHLQVHGARRGRGLQHRRPG